MFGLLGSTARGKTILEWNLNHAKNQNPPWRSAESLPSQVPDAAKGLVLTPESLKRCLVLISLVLEGCKSHLKIAYPEVSA